MCIAYIGQHYNGKSREQVLTSRAKRRKAHASVLPNLVSFCWEGPNLSFCAGPKRSDSKRGEIHVFKVHQSLGFI